MRLERRRQVLLGFGLGLALAAAVPAVRLASAQSPAPESESATPALGAPPGEIRFVGRNLTSKARGVFHRWRIREQRLDPARLEEAFAVVEVDLASVDTGNERRDTHLRHPDFFGVETHPFATVRVHSARRAGASAEGHPLYEASFELDLHGVTKTLQGEIEVLGATDPEGGGLRFEGRLTIDRTQFGVGPPPSRWSPFSIDPEIPVSFRVVIPTAPPSAASAALP